jgi:hypothetical protein
VKLRQHLPAALLLLYFAFVLHGILFTTAGVFERDGFYHARYAQMLPERGLSRAFPWMQFTDWKDKFADKDFLYHVVLAPFCSNASEPLPGAKWATLLLALGAYLAFYLVLVRLGVRWPLAWLALLMVGSGLFLNRMIMVRSHVLSVGLMIVSAYAILKQHTRLCFLCGFVYAWSYSFPLAMVITAFAAAAGRFVLSDREWRVLKIPAASAAGVALGLLIHPYSPNTLALVWTLLKISSSRASGVQLELGSEFLPIFSASSFDSIEAFGNGILSLLIEIPGPLLALIVAAVLAGLLRAGRLRGRTLSADSAAALGAAIAWFAAIFVFSRLVEYFAPLAILAAALAVRDALGPVGPQKPFAQNHRAVAAALGATVMLAGLFFLSMEEVLELAESTRPHHPNQIYVSDPQWQRGQFFSNPENGGAAQWMREHLPAHATVVNFHWDDFTELYYDAPEFNYVVGLDPTLMRLPYPEHSAILEAMRTKQIPLDFSRLHQLFGADYLIMRNTRAAQYPELKNRMIVPVFADDGAVIYKIN